MAKNLIEYVTRFKKKQIVILVTLVFVIIVGVIFGVRLMFGESEENNIAKVYQEPVINSREDIPIDFEELKKENDEIYAWIKIPGTKVDYPILQSKEDNNFYLTNDQNKNESLSGAIYTQFYNSTDFNDFNTIVYGHNMKDGTMFGDLKKFKDKDFFDEYQDVIIYMPSRVIKYKIFSSYTYDDRHIMSTFNFSSRVDRKIYLDSLLEINDENALFRDEVELDTNNRLLTLSTCTTNKESRLLVQAVLIEDHEY